MENILKCVVILIVTIQYAYCDKESVTESFKTSNLVPDLIPVAPSDVLKVKYNTVEVSAGDEMAPSEVMEKPQVTWYNDCEWLYTIIMLDSDAPCHDKPEASPFNHWLVVNVPGDNLESGDVLAEYFPPSPPPCLGDRHHRYTFLVYEQSWSFEVDDFSTLRAASRMNFPLLEFTKKYELGNPIAGNFFKAQNEML